MSIAQRLLSRAALVVLAVALAIAAEPAADAGSAHITANPSSIMVNSTTTLTGTGFAPKTRITLAECGSKLWSVPQQNCGSNTVQVHTNAKGGFTKTFTVTLCPNSGGRPTDKVCFIGEPTPNGIDTIHLVGAVRIHVTYP